MISALILIRNARRRQYKTQDDEMVDLQGKTMLPGFIDAHSHFVGAANAMTQCDLSECTSFSQIVECMKMFISPGWNG